MHSWAYPDKPANVINFTTISGEQEQEWAYKSGDHSYSLAIPATAENIIAVSAYTTRNQWDADSSCCQLDFELGNILDFSSRGPSVDPHRLGVKPEITAPGAMIASTLSRHARVSSEYVLEDGEHVMMAGTSMAAPFVSGTAALMLSLRPNLTHIDVERILTETAYVDEAVGAVPNSAWGYGKLDVLKAVEATLNTQVVGDAAQSTDGEEVGGAGNSGGGCSFVSGQQGSFAVSFYFFFALLLLFRMRKVIQE